MIWTAPILPLLRGRPRIVDRHRAGYFREYHQRNLTKRRAYLAAKAREYRRAS